MRDDEPVRADERTPIEPSLPLQTPAPRHHRLAVLVQRLRSPLLLLWIFGAVGIVGGIVEWLFLDGLPWQGLGAAGIIAGVTKLAARVRGIPAWPWESGQKQK